MECKIILTTPQGHAVDMLLETMSITKSAVGLAFLAKDHALDQLNRIPLLDSVVDITLEQALCHQTGIENDASFLWSEFESERKRNNTFNYARDKFVQDLDNKEFTRSFSYNNIVWRVLVSRFEELYGEKLSVFLKRIEGLEHATFKGDVDGYMNGMNGMMLTCSMAKAYAKWARGILLQNRNKLMAFSGIKHSVFGRLAGDQYRVYPFYGWFIVTRKKKFEPVAAIAFGYWCQYICIGLLDKNIYPKYIGIQLRHEYYVHNNNDTCDYPETWLTAYLGKQ